MTKDIWEQLNDAAEKVKGFKQWSPFVNGGGVASAIESESGKIFTGICFDSCSGVGNLCAERVAILKMASETGEVVVKRLLASVGPLYPKEELNNWSPCGACRELLMQLSDKNKDCEIMVDFERRKTIKLKELIPHWWGNEEFKKSAQ
jgi:cytidine deaminase